MGIDKPYNIGDWIEFEDGTIGQVVDITWRSTRILSWNASLYVVPNKKAAHITVHNYSWPTKTYGYWFNVSVSSEISPLVVRQLLLEAALKCKQVADEPVPNIYLSDINSGVIMKSPNGTCFRMTIQDNGTTLITQLGSCPQ